MNDRNFHGAKWWKFDFHAHTPASHDFLQGVSDADKKKITPENWLRKFMVQGQGIDCVAVTDHNNGAWIDKLKNALADMEQEKPPWYRKLYLFPGVEISVNGGTHMLAVFGEDKTGSDIDGLVGAVGYQGEKGNSNGVTTKSFIEVAQIITKRGGIPIPAHAHNFRQSGFGRFTWVKMDAPPSFEGLKLALLDGTASVNRNMDDKPNKHSEYYIEKIKINNAKYIGHGEEIEPLKCQFSPFLSAIIGGRGSGKSTLLEFMRLVLRRKQEIPDTLKAESNKYFNTGGENLLLHNTVISLTYRKNNIRYRLNWSQDEAVPALEVEKNNKWTYQEGEISSLLPVYIYSQKQILELARQPEALLKMIDKASAVDYEGFKEKSKEYTRYYKQLQQQITEIEHKLSRKPELTGKLDDTTWQINQIENSGYKDIYKNYQKRKKQLATINSLEERWRQMSDSLRDTAGEISPVQFNDSYIKYEQDLLPAINTANKKWEKIRNALKGLHQESFLAIEEWQHAKKKSSWKIAMRHDMDSYNALEHKDFDPDKHRSLSTLQSQYQKELAQIEESGARIEKLKKEQRQVLTKIYENRKELTQRRRNFLAKISDNNDLTTIKIEPFSQEWTNVEKSLRKILQRFDTSKKEFEQIEKIYDDAETKDEAIENIRAYIRSIRQKKRAGHNAGKLFAEHVENLPQESIDDLLCWLPEDNLTITFGKKNQNIQEGSPGQKSAALLAFILSFGDEPLILDQPEDDLDNELIYELIVKQLRNTKSRRQIIVVTHNANIVVNGDAEMVIPMEVSNGQSVAKVKASIQNKVIREKICDILEGGRHAFEQRYKRIHLENA